MFAQEALSPDAALGPTGNSRSKLEGTEAWTSWSWRLTQRAK